MGQAAPVGRAKVRKDLADRLGTLAFALSVIAGMAAALLLFLAFVQTAQEKLKLREWWTTHLLEDISVTCELPQSVPPDGDIAVDTRGRVWVAWKCRTQAEAGVSVYDGKNWTIYSSKTSGIKIGEVRALVADPQGRVWIYGPPGGDVMLAVFDGQTWKHLTLRVQFSSELAVDRRGWIWSGGYSDGYPSVSVFDGTRLTTYTPANSGLVNNGPGVLGVAALAVDAQNRLWIAVSDGGVSVFDGRSWVTFSHDPLPFVTKIVFDKKGVAWLGTRSGGLISYDGVKWTEHVRDTSFRGGYGGGIQNITFDALGRIWVLGTDPDRSRWGLRVYDGQKWTSLTSENSGMQGDPIAVAADHQGRVWIVTTKAVNVVPQDWMPK